MKSSAPMTIGDVAVRFGLATSSTARRTAIMRTSPVCAEFQTAVATRIAP